MPTKWYECDNKIELPEATIECPPWEADDLQLEQSLPPGWLYTGDGGLLYGENPLELGWKDQSILTPPIPGAFALVGLGFYVNIWGPSAATVRIGVEGEFAIGPVHMESPYILNHILSGIQSAGIFALCKTEGRQVKISIWPSTNMSGEYTPEFAWLLVWRGIRRTQWKT